MPETTTTPAIDPSPMRELLRIALPSVAATTSYTVMQFVDKFMVSKIGPDPIYVGSQGSGGLAAWIPISFMYGTLAVTNTFVSQNLGAGQSQRGPAYAWNALWIALVASILLIPYGFALPRLFEALGYDLPRAHLASSYGQIMVFGAFLSMATRGIGQYFYGMHRPKVVMTASIVGNLVNFFFNWVLVLGHLGAPKLGVVGAGLATLIGSCVEGLIPFCVFVGPRMNNTYHTRSQWRPSAAHMREIMSVGWPAGAMFISEMICWGYFMIKLVGAWSKEANTAGFITQQWMSLSFMPAVGISFAVSATVGKYLGMKRPDLAAQRAAIGIRLAMIYMGSCAVLFVLLRAPMIELFIPASASETDRATVLNYGTKFLIATSAFQLFDAMAVTISGALRGAGDTHFLGVATTVLAWGVMAGGGWAFVTYLPHLGPIGPWIASSAYIILLALVSLYRYRGGAWRTMSVVKTA